MLINRTKSEWWYYIVICIKGLQKLNMTFRLSAEAKNEVAKQLFTNQEYKQALEAYNEAISKWKYNFFLV